MKVMVAGATGFIGKELIKRLNEKGYEIVALARNPDSSRFHIPGHCEIQAWDPVKNFLRPTALKDVEAVINLAGKGIADGRWTPIRKMGLIESRILSTRRLVDAMTYMDKKPCVFLSASAIGFYGERGDELLNETKPKGKGFLSDICQSWEDEALRANELGVRTANFRIGMVLGHDGGALNKILPPFKFGIGGNWGNGPQWMNWIHIKDLADMFVYGIEKSSVKGIYNAVSPNPIKNKEFTKKIGKSFKSPHPVSRAQICVENCAGRAF